MRTYFFVLLLAFFSLSRTSRQRAGIGSFHCHSRCNAPSVTPKERQAPQNDSDQEPINKDQGKVPDLPQERKPGDVVFNVKDKHGTLVPSLEKDRFELLEDGKPQTIKYFSALY